MNSIRTIIVDDESEAREGLERLLRKDPDIEIVGLCSNGIEAIELINNQAVDLALLDIQMPVVNGFDVIRSVRSERLPWIIFVTAYDNYSIKAFEVHAIDYILKPFTDTRLFDSIQRAKELIRQKKARDHFLKIGGDKGSDSLVDQGISDRLVIKENGVVLFLEYKEVSWVEAFDYYIKIHLKGRFHVVRSSMKKMEEMLPSSHFLRIHRSTIVNRNAIESIQPGLETLRLVDGSVRNVGRTYRDQLNGLLP